MSLSSPVREPANPRTRERLHARLHPFPRRLNERFEQRLELAGAPEILRVPLDADAEWRVRLFDPLDHSIRRAGVDDQAIARLSDRLVVPAVDAAAAGAIQAILQHGGQPRACRDVNLVALEILGLLDR